MPLRSSYRRCGSGGPGLSCPLPRKTCPVSGDSSHAGGRVVEISSGSEPGHPRRKRWRAGWEAGTPAQPPWPEAHLASPRDLVLIAHPICWEEPRPGQDAPSSSHAGATGGDSVLSHCSADSKKGPKFTLKATQAASRSPCFRPASKSLPASQPTTRPSSLSAPAGGFLVSLTSQYRHPAAT